jgi:hypothetical protein
MVSILTRLDAAGIKRFTGIPSRKRGDDAEFAFPRSSGKMKLKQSGKISLSLKS